MTRARLAKRRRDRYIHAMAKRITRTRNAGTGQFVTVRKPGRTARSSVTFGSVTVSGVRPPANVVEANVAISSSALKRAVKKIIKPGVALRTKFDVPRFSVSDDDPGVFVRRLNGVEQRGRLVNGTFEVID